MTIQEFITTYAPSSHAVEKTLNILSAFAPHPDFVWRVLNTLSTFAPNPASVWMLPLAALILAIVHALITRKAGMMVAAAFILCFYTAGNLLLPSAEVSNAKQMVLLTTLHTWFSCVAVDFFFFCVACSLTGHFIAMGWRYYRAKKEPRVTIVAPVATTSVAKKAPVPKPRSTTTIKPKTLNELASPRTVAPKKRIRQEPTL